MDDNVRKLPSKVKRIQKNTKAYFEAVVDDAKEFFNKPMSEATIGDMIVQATIMFVISTGINLSVQGWIMLLQKSTPSNERNSNE